MLHSMKRKQHHKVVSTTKALPTSTTKELKCGVHCEQRLKLWCNECYEMICAECTLTAQHRGHEVQYIDEIRVELNESLQRAIVEASSAIDISSKNVSMLEKGISDIKKDYHKISVEVEKEFKTVIDALLAKQNAILTQLTITKDIAVSNMEKQRESHASKLNRLLQRLKLGEKMLIWPHDTEFYQMYPIFNKPIQCEQLGEISNLEMVWESSEPSWLLESINNIEATFTSEENFQNDDNSIHTEIVEVDDRSWMERTLSIWGRDRIERGSEREMNLRRERRDEPRNDGERWKGDDSRDKDARRDRYESFSTNSQRLDRSEPLREESIKEDRAKRPVERLVERPAERHVVRPGRRAKR